jgi:hypothetical protein
MMTPEQEAARDRYRENRERDDLSAVARRSLSGGHEKTTPGAEALARQVLGQMGADAPLPILRVFQAKLMQLWKQSQGFIGDWKPG